MAEAQLGPRTSVGAVRADDKCMKRRKAKAQQTTTDSIAEGQAGDLQGLSDVEEADSESVGELVEEGQSFEAGILDGVENAADPDVAEVTTKEVLEDDVPSEYLEDK